jgi:hypothetical protein
MWWFMPVISTNGEVDGGRKISSLRHARAKLLVRPCLKNKIETKG